jgi:nucleotide-binding universal stress UspA family protein
VGDHALPANELPQGVSADRIRWERYHEHGDLGSTTEKFAVSQHIDLIVMATDGRDNLKDEVIRSIIERVVHRFRRPVISVPSA